MFVYNPESFEPEKVLPKKLQKFSDHARYFIHKIYEQRVKNRRRDEEFVPLKADYLRKVISYRKYKSIREFLIEKRYIETDNSYIRGRKCIGYKIGGIFDADKYKRIKLNNKSLIRKITKENEFYKKRITLDTHKHLYKFLQKLDIDHDNAYRNINHEDSYINRISIDMIKYKQWFFQFDEYGRVHTNVSNLKSKFRKFLLFNKNPLVEIDIRNSQPFFLIYLIFSHYSNLFKFSFSNSSPLYPIFSHYSNLFKFSFSNSSPLYPIRCDIFEKPDVQKYIDLVVLGNLYDYLMEEGKVDILDRKEFKRRLFVCIFFGRNVKWNTREKDIFMSHFPTIYKIICDFKKKDYTFLSKQLQKIESRFVIGKVVRRCMEEYPEEFITTIHDSVLTTEAFVDKLHEIMGKELTFAGYSPKLSIRYFNERILS